MFLASIALDASLLRLKSENQGFKVTDTLKVPFQLYLVSGYVVIPTIYNQYFIHSQRSYK